MYTRDVVYEGKWGDDMRNSDIVFRRNIIGNVASSPYFGQPVPWDVIYNSGGDEATHMANQSLCYPISCKIATDPYKGLAEGENRSRTDEQREGHRGVRTVK